MTDLGEIRLPYPAMNAAGPWASTSEQLESIYKSLSGAVVTKTFTIEPRSGNDEPNQYFTDDFSINSVGLQNNGLDYFVEAVNQLGSEKPIIASVAESSSERLADLVGQLGRTAFTAVELNLSCPNLANTEPVAYRPHELDEFLGKVFQAAEMPVGIKLPPYVTRTYIREAASVISRYPVNHLVLTNTFPLASAFIDNESVIKPNEGIGGMGGRYLKYIALAHVILFDKYLPHIPIIGVGGIEDAHDVEEFNKAGATAVQIGTAIHNKGLGVFDEISGAS